MNSARRAAHMVMHKERRWKIHVCLYRLGVCCLPSSSSCASFKAPATLHCTWIVLEQDFHHLLLLRKYFKEGGGGGVRVSSCHSRSVAVAL